MARGYEWAFVVSQDSAAMIDHVPFVGTATVTLWVPTIQLNQGALFARLRHAFPKALGRKP